MNTLIQPISDISHRAKNILIQELGVIDAMRFLNQFRVGSGNYTAEREQLFRQDSVKSIVADIKKQRKGHA